MDKEAIYNLRKIIDEQYNNIAGIVILKNDQIILEDYLNGFNQNSTVHIASVTKSIMSALTGIAVDQGAIESIDQNVLDFFPHYTVKGGEKTLQKIKVRDLLTMTAPWKFRSEPYTKVYSSDDWTTAALDLLGGKGELGVFKYTTVGLQVLSGILYSATGQSPADFAVKHLFGPLDIQAPDNMMLRSKEEHLAFLKDKDVKGWVVDPRGINTAGWGLTMKTVDMSKIGQLYLNKGIWKGRRIISSNWIEESCRIHSSWGDLSYGYLWWILNGGKNPPFAALGDGGNVIYISPDNQLVVAIASGFMPRAKDRIQLIEKHILPFL